MFAKDFDINICMFHFLDQPSQDGGMDNPVYASTVERNVNMEEGDASDLFDSHA